MIEDGLTDLSTMEEVVKEGDVVNEFTLDEIDVGEGELLITPTNNITDVNYKFCIKRSNNSFIIFYWKNIRHMTVGSMMRIKNLHEDNVVIIK